MSSFVWFGWPKLGDLGSHALRYLVCQVKKCKTVAQTLSMTLGSSGCVSRAEWTHFDAGRYDQTAIWKRKGLQERPGTAWINRTLSVAYARLGERTAALDSINTLHRQSPDLTTGQIASFIEMLEEHGEDLGAGGARPGGKISDHRHGRLLGARHKPARCNRAAEERDEFAPLHCSVPPVLPDRKDSTLRCGISIRLMTALGHVQSSKSDCAGSG